jgi:hypothetical protein
MSPLRVVRVAEDTRFYKLLHPTKLMQEGIESHVMD